MKWLKLFSFLCISFLLPGCLPTMQIEQSGIINTRGVDLVEEDGEQLIETTIIPYLFDANADEITSILVGRAHTMKQAREEAAKQSSYKLTPGQIRLEVYGREAAEEGVLIFLSTLTRDARVSDSMQLAVTNQTAREILENEQETIEINPAQYLQDLLAKEKERDTLPDNSLHAFARIAEETGIDPVLPIIDIKDNLPTLVGTAIFQDDRYVAQTAFSDAFLINIMGNRVKGSPIEAAVPYKNYRDYIYKRMNDESIDEEELIYLSLWLTSGNGKTEIMNKEPLHFHANINLKGELLEVSDMMNVRTKEVVAQLEKDIEQYYVAQFEALFSKLQEVNADAFGLGQLYRSTREGSAVTKEEWLDKYPEVTIEFNVNFTLVDFGTID